MTDTYPAPIQFRQTANGVIANHWPPSLSVSARCLELMGEHAQLDGDLLIVTAENGTATYQLGQWVQNYQYKGQPWRLGRLVSLRTIRE